MKNLPGVLVFSTVLVLATGCPKDTGEAPGPTDASAAPGPAPSEGTQPGTSRGAVTAPGDAGAMDAGAPGMDAGPPGADAGTSRQAQEACMDRWLKANGLDRYGHPEGTMYAGGTPLFDERTGEQRDRLDYVFERKPEAREACAGGPPAR